MAAVYRGLLCAVAVFLVNAAIAFADPPPIVEYGGASGSPNVITQGPDGAMWFTEFNGNRIGRIAIDGSSIVEYPRTGPGLTAGAQPSGIVAGHDGKLWFTEFGTGQIGELDPVTGALVGEYPVPSALVNSPAHVKPQGITVAPDGSLWFAEAGTGLIGRVDPTAVSPGTSNGITEFETKYTDHASAIDDPTNVAFGPDGKLWVSLTGLNSGAPLNGGLDRVDTSAVSPGTFQGVSYFPLPTTTSQPEGLLTGPDGKLWVAEIGAGQVARVDTAAVSENTTSGITETTIAAGFAPLNGAAGHDGGLWFAGPTNGNSLLRIDPLTPSTQDKSSLGIAGAPNAGAADAAGNFWFTEFSANAIGVVLLAPKPTAGTPRLVPAAPRQGQGVTCDPDAADWTNAPVFSYAWKLDATPITGATGATYVPGAADVGHRLTCEVTGTNAKGSAIADSASAAVLPATPPPPSAPSASLDNLTPHAKLGQVLSVSAGGSHAPNGARLTGYDFRLGAGPGAQQTHCPAQLPRLNLLVSRPVTSTITVTASASNGTSATTSVPISLATAALPRFRNAALAADGRRGSAHAAARTSPSLGPIPAVTIECVPASGGSNVTKRSRGVSSVHALEEAPQSARPSLPDCAKELKVGIISGLGCFVAVDSNHPLPAAESAILCRHERNTGLLIHSACGGTDLKLPPSLFQPSGPATADVAAGCSDPTGYDAVYYSTQPVGIDGLEIDPVNGGAIVLARAGADCTNFIEKDSAYLISSDAVVKLGGLPISLHVPDYAGTYSKLKGSVNCAQSVGQGLANGSLDGANCLGSVSLPPLSLDGKLIPQVHGPIDLGVSPRELGIELGEFHVPDNVLPLPVLPSLPLSGTIRVNLTGIDSASVAIHVELPQVLSDGQGHGVTGDTTLAINNVTGLQLNSLDIVVPSLAQLGLARLRDLELHYRSPSRFDTKGTIDLSDVIHGLVTIHLIIDKGRFQNGSVLFASHAGDGLPLFGPLFLTQLSAGLSLDPVHISGSTQISVGPAVLDNGCGALSIHGTADLVFGNPWTLDATGAAQILCADFGPSKVFHADSDGHFSYGERLDYPIPGLGEIVGDEFGQAYIDLHGQLIAQLDGRLAGNININLCHDFGWPLHQQCLGNVSFNPELDGTISIGERSGHLIGMAGVCAHLGAKILGQDFGFDVGAGTGDLPGTIASLATNNVPALASRFQILLDNCDISKWRLLPPPPGFAPDGRARAAAMYSFDIPAGQRIGVIGVQAAGARPDLLLTGPGGRRIQVSTDGMHIDGGAFVMRQPSTGQVLIEIPHPPAGRWTVQDAPGAPALKAVELAHTMPTPSIRVTVGGAGRHRVLRYRIAPQPGLGVSFIETVGKGGAPIGSAHGAHGTVRFTPAVGSSARRTIIARITRNGLAAPSIVVGHYLPGRVRPGTASQLGVRRRAGTWVLTWRPGSAATAQQVTVRFASGQQVLVAVGASARSLRLTRALGSGTRPTAVEIVALRSQTRGRPALLVAKLTRRRR